MMDMDELEILVGKLKDTVLDLTMANIKSHELSTTMQEIVREARETAEHARFTANSAAAGLTGLVVAHQRIEKTVGQLAARVDALEQKGTT